MNTNRLIILGGAIAYITGVLLAWFGDGAVDRTPLLYVNMAYAVLLLGGSYGSEFVRRHITAMMAIAIYSIQTHALYLIWENNLSVSLVAACSSISLAPIATFGYAFKTLKQLLPFLLATIAAALFVGLSLEAPQTDPTVFIVTNVSLCGICLIAVTGQLRTLESLRKNSQRQRALVDAIPDAMLRIAKDGTVLDTSADPQTRIGLYLADGATLNLKPAIERTLQSGMENEELKLVGTDDTPLHIEVRMVKSGETEVTAILRDMTSEKALKARLMIADRMGAIGTLSVGIGHEINNPLTFIESNVRFAMDEIATSAPGPARDAVIVEALEDAAEGAHRVKCIVDDLRRSVRADESAASVSNASKAINFAVRVAGSQLRHQAELKVDLPDEVNVIGSESKLGQVFLNLILNSMQAFEGATENNKIEVRLDDTDADFLTFEIEDNGLGIPADIQHQVFDPFFTTKEVGEGTGLGLYICHQIVTDCGGELSLESELNKGTTVRVKLRRATLRHDEAKSLRSEARTQLRVLVIDDEPGVLRACKRMLNKHDVTICGEAPEALRLISDGDYDAIICDLMMPKMTGMDLHESVERSSPEKAERMVFITGGAFRSDAESFLKAHAEQYLPKPFSRDSLLDAVDRVARRTS